MTETVERHIPPETAGMIEEATRLLADAAHPEKIILFGSYARGDFDRHSDLDLLVIVSSVGNRIVEAARLRQVLAAIPMAIDIIVYPRSAVEERGHLPGTMLFEVLRQGRVLYDAA